LPLPVAFSQLQFIGPASQKTFALKVAFSAPHFKFMPKILFQNVTGSVQVNIRGDKQREIDVYMNGFAEVDGQLFYSTV